MKAPEHELRVMQCGTCGVWHAIPQHMFDEYRRQGGFWHCPNGHQRGWEEGTEKTEIAKLQRAVEAERQAKLRERVRAIDAEAETAQVQRSHNKMRRRISAGTCPCCRRTFQNLYDHMRKQHPDFGNPQTFKAVRELFGLTQAQVAKELGIPAAYVSLYECGKPVTQRAARLMSEWMERAA